MIEKVLEFVRHPHAGRFEPLALKVFAYQYDKNTPYRNFCKKRKITPDAIRSYKEIPALPTAAFKELDLACGPAEAMFLSSGTTQGPDKRSRHIFPRVEVYNTSLTANFSAHVLPEGKKMPMVILAAPPSLLPQSSLSYMLEMVKRDYGTEKSTYVLTEKGLDQKRLRGLLGEAEKEGMPLCLLGVTIAFADFFSSCHADGFHVRLPAGSRIMDTGGSKGRVRETSRSDLHAACSKILGVPDTLCVNEYGMTEMGSQFYDNVLVDHLRGEQHPRYKVIPPWVRTVVVDPETLTEVPPGTPGLLRHYDLANCGSVMAIQTEDVGVAIDKGFEILGRARGAGARGCALAVEEFLKRTP